MPRTVVTISERGSNTRRRPKMPKGVTAQARKMRGGQPTNLRTSSPTLNQTSEQTPLPPSLPRSVSPERFDGASGKDHFAVMICGDVTEFIHTACETFTPEDQHTVDNDSIIDETEKVEPPSDENVVYSQYSKPVVIEDDEEDGFDMDKQVSAPQNPVPFLRDISYQSVLTEAQTQLLEAQNQLTIHLDTAAKEIQRAFPLENVSLVPTDKTQGPVIVDDDGYFEDFDNYSEAEAKPGSLQDITNNYRSVVNDATNQLTRVLSVQSKTPYSMTPEDFDKHFCMQWSVKCNVLPGLDRWKGVMRSNKNGSTKEGPPLGLVQGYWVRRHQSTMSNDAQKTSESNSVSKPLCGPKNALELVDLDKLDPGLGHFWKVTMSHGWPDEASDTPTTTYSSDETCEANDLSQVFSESGGNYDDAKNVSEKHSLSSESFECCLVSHVWIAPQFRGEGLGLVLSAKASSVVPYRYHKEQAEAKLSIALAIPPFAKKLKEHFAKSGIWKEGWHEDFLIR